MSSALTSRFVLVLSSLSFSSVVAQGSSASSTGVGDFVAQGLGLSTTPTSSSTLPSSKTYANSSSSDAGLPTSFPVSIATPTWTVPATGSGPSFATACNVEQLLYSYLTDSQQRYGDKTASTSYLTLTSFEASTTTLCDGHPRVVGSLTSVGTTVNSTVFSTAITTSIPSPTCLIQPDQYSAYLDKAWSSAYNGPNSTITVHLDAALSVITINSANGTSTTSTFIDAQITSAPDLTIEGTTFGADSNKTYWVQVWPGSFDPITPGDTFTITQFQEGAYNMPQLETVPSSTNTVPANATTETGPAITATTRIIHNSTTSESCPCTIAGQNVRLLYFPATTSTSRNQCQTTLAQGTLCPYGGATVVNAQNSVSIAIEEQVDNGSVCPFVPLNYTKTENSGPYTVSSGTTFYENRAYLAFDYMSATRACGYAGGVAGQLGTTDPLMTTTYVGGQYTDGLIELPSSALYSGCGYSYFYDEIGYSFNFADLQQPVPASAFLCQPSCFEAVAYPTSTYMFGDYINGKAVDPAFCNLIIESEYKPQLLVPPQARTIDPAWSTCVLKLQGLYDPPIALQAADSVVVPTISSIAVPTGAAPASSPDTQAPPKTSAAADNLPTNAPSPAANPSNNGNSGDDGGSDQEGNVAGAVASAAAAATSDAASTAQQTTPEQATPAQASEEQVDPGQAQSENSPAIAGTTIGAFAGSLNNNNPSDGGAGRVATTFEVDGQAVTASQDPASPSVVYIGGTALTAGNPGVTVAGNTIALGSNGLVVGAAPTVVATVNGQGIVATQAENGQPAAVMGGTTLTEGGAAATISGTVVSVASGGVILDGSQTVPLSDVGSGVASTIAGQDVTAIPLQGGQTAAVTDGTTLTEGGPAATVDGTVISVASGGLVVGGSQTLPLSPGDARATSEAILTLGSVTVTALEASGTGEAIVVDGATLSPGGLAATIDGTVVSAVTNGIVVGSSTTVSLSRVTDTTSSGQGNAHGTTLRSELGQSTLAAGTSSTTSNAAGRERPLNAVLWIVAAVSLLCC